MTVADMGSRVPFVYSCEVGSVVIAPHSQPACVRANSNKKI